jgi:hypothetical protein
MSDGVKPLSFFPLNEVVLQLDEAARILMEKYGKHVLREVLIDPDFALNFGMLPGSTSELNVSCGTITVRADRRSVPRTFCGKYFCNLPAGHVGYHRGPCACYDGCAAEGCPNKS